MEIPEDLPVDAECNFYVTGITQPIVLEKQYLYFALIPKLGAFDQMY